MQIDKPGPIGIILDAIVDRIDASAQRLARRIRAEQLSLPLPNPATPEQAELVPIDLHEEPTIKIPAPTTRQITDRHSTRYVVPDPDYVAELEASDGQRLKRMAHRDRGKPIKPPQPR